MTPSSSLSSLAPLSPTNRPKEQLKSPHANTTVSEDSLRPLSTSESTTSQTRIAPNLSLAPIIVDILSTPDAAAGCVDPAKKRIVLASRFSSRAGADRRIYTSTLDGAGSSAQVYSDNGQVSVDRKVVAIGGAWQAKADELATPARNPMSLVLDHENCVVGTSEGLVYRMAFVGADYSKGWVEEGKGEDEQEVKDDKDEREESTVHKKAITISNLLHLRSVWKHLFV